MRVFLSYRRDDTAGRARRLSDGLTARLGAGNVFQDVGSIALGVDFEHAVLGALAETDATIVVIGRDWATLRGPDGSRRLDHPGDYVRREVAAALSSGGPVVPVLVGDSLMPGPEEVPDELGPLLKRQAIAMRDVTWNEDVDGLVRRLRAEVEPPRVSRRGLVGIAAVGAAIVLAAGSAVLWSRGGSRGGSAGNGDDQMSPCSVVDEGSWSTIPLAADPRGTYLLTDGTARRVGYTAMAVRATDGEPTWRVVVDIQVSNESAAVDGTSDDDWYIGAADFNRLVTDGVAGGQAVCFNLLSGAQALPPAQRAIIRVGFDSPTDPRQAELLLETDGTPIPLTPGGT